MPGCVGVTPLQAHHLQLYLLSLSSFVRRLFMRLHDEHSAAAQIAFSVVISPNLIKSLATHSNLCVWIIYVVKM